MRHATSRSFGSAQIAQVDTSSDKSDMNIEDRDKGVEKWFETLSSRCKELKNKCAREKAR